MVKNEVPAPEELEGLQNIGHCGKGVGSRVYVFDVSSAGKTAKTVVVACRQRAGQALNGPNVLKVEHGTDGTRNAKTKFA